METMDYISSKIEKYIENNKGLYSLNGYIQKEDIKKEFYSIVSYLYNQKKEDKNFTIGIFLDKDYKYLLTLLASMYVGVTYIPLSKKLPLSRVNQIIDIAEINMIISDKEDDFNADNNLIDVIIETQRIDDIDFVYTDKSTLYIMFTSGSTGAPKGVMIPRNAYESFLKWMSGYYDIDSTDKILFITEFTFDISLVDIGLLIEKNIEFYFSKFNGNIIDVMQELEKYEINVVSTVPSNFTMLLSNRIIKRFKIQPLKLLILSGSKITKKLYDLVRDFFPDTNFFNGYGPTEATIFITSKYFDDNYDFDGNNASVGIETSDTRITLLDENKKEISDESIGEVFVASKQLMLGYKNNEEKTKEVLINIDGVRYYSVGDLGYIKNNNLYIVGRVDDTIKTKGYRVNLSDIESYTHKLEYINESVIIAIEDENIENKLYLFVTLHQNIDKNDIFNDLKKILPDYQMPADIIIKDEMPLNNSGKISKIDLKKDLSI